MLILALDTSTRSASCALAHDGVVVHEVAGDPSQPQAVRLPGELMALLDREGVSLHDIDAFAVATGPGSFTGLRIGIASMQGLAFAEHKPLIGVSALDTLAVLGAAAPQWRGEAHPSVPRWTCTWVDAWRGDVYAALYENGEPAGEPVVAGPAGLLADLVARATDGVRAAGDFVFIGDGAATYRELITAALGDRARIAEPAVPLLAATIARLATTEYSAGHRPPPHAIRPLYVRRPDAELARQRRAELRTASAE